MELFRLKLLLIRVHEHVVLRANVILDFLLIIDARFFSIGGARHKIYLSRGIVIAARTHSKAVDLKL